MKKQLTINVPPRISAWMRWQADVEGLKRDELITKVLREYHNKVSKTDPNTPTIEED